MMSARAIVRELSISLVFHAAYPAPSTLRAWPSRERVSSSSAMRSSRPLTLGDHWGRSSKLQQMGDHWGRSSKLQQRRSLGSWGRSSKLQQRARIFARDRPLRSSCDPDPALPLFGPRQHLACQNHFHWTSIANQNFLGNRTSGGRCSVLARNLPRDDRRAVIITGGNIFEGKTPFSIRLSCV